MDEQKFTGKLERFNSDLWGYHILVPEKIAELFMTVGTKRLIAIYNEQIKSHCALMSRGDGRYFININKEIRTKLKLQIGTPFNVKLSPDESKYGMDMPEEFQVLLDQDIEGNRYFHLLTPGKQRSLIYQVGKLKNPDKRLEKANVILEFLKWNEGKLDFKALNLAFKEAKR